MPKHPGSTYLGTLPFGALRGPSSVLKEFAKVAAELPPVGFKGPMPFARLTRNMVPLVVLHHIAICPPPPPAHP